MSVSEWRHGHITLKITCSVMNLLQVLWVQAQRDSISICKHNCFARLYGHCSYCRIVTCKFYIFEKFADNLITDNNGCGVMTAKIFAEIGKSIPPPPILPSKFFFNICRITQEGLKWHKLFNCLSLTDHRATIFPRLLEFDFTFQNPFFYWWSYSLWMYVKHQ